MAQVLENDEIRLHPDDAVSTRLLIKQLSSKGTLTFYKDKQDCTLIDSRLPDNAFVVTFHGLFFFSLCLPILSHHMTAYLICHLTPFLLT